MIKFDYYTNDIRAVKPMGSITLKQFLDGHQKPRGIVKKRINEIGSTRCPKQKTLLKSKLYYFTPCVISKDGRSYAHIEKFTKLLVLDFDKVPDAVNLRDKLFANHNFIMAAWLSPSRKGIKCFVEIPQCNTVAEFKSYYWGLYKELNIYAGLDITGQNPILPLYISYDHNIKSRLGEHEVWKKKGVHPTQEKRDNKPPVIVSEIKTSDSSVRNIIALSQSIIDKSQDNGYPQVVKAGLMMGGYVASGYLPQSEAEAILISQVLANVYLAKNKSKYQKIGTDFIAKGMDTPLALD